MLGKRISISVLIVFVLCATLAATEVVVPPVARPANASEKPRDTRSVGASEKPTAQTPLVEGNTAFAVELYGKLREQEGNLFLSPYSISTALAMTYAGARGETEKQMASVLHFTKLEEGLLHPTFGQLNKSIDAGQKKGYEIHVANALWGQKGYSFLSEFTSLTKEHYGGGLRKVDFVSDPGQACNRINRWVKRETRNNIRELVGPDVVNNLTRLVLTNAIYFKGDWGSPFKKRDTKEEPFTLSTGETVEVDMMNQTAGFPYAEEDGLQVLELPYKGREVSMVIFLPWDTRPLPEFEKSLSPDRLKKWLSDLRMQQVEVSVPRWEIESAFLLKTALQSMGMTDAFVYGEADLSGMDGTNELYLQAVLHKGYVRVDEKGTEAAAATAVVVESIGPPDHPPTFRADHPFFYLIRHRPTGTILFMGRVANPAPEKESKTETP